MTFTVAFFIDSIPFGPGEIDGTKSLGGSESACVGLARALQARGHRVHIFTTQLAEDAPRVDQVGVNWHPASALLDITRVIEWDVFVALRMPMIFASDIRARLRVLWNQDLMNTESYKKAVMANAFAIDRIAYVSAYHRQQWEGWLPELKPFGWVTKNGFDPAHVPADAAKDPNRIIHISRPERGLGPLLEMWPAFRAKHPDAVLQVCRYSSMYDAQGWGAVCAAFDRRLAAIHAEVGGIEFLGELGKPALYRAIAEAAVMWYPGVPDFAETSCIAAIEAQACGTPFVGSYKGALPETVPSGILVRGDAYANDYQAESMKAVGLLLEGCKGQSVGYRRRQMEGRAHVEPYTYARIAAEWEGWLEDTFRTRYETQKLGVLRQLLHYDDHTAALQVAREIRSEYEPDAPGFDDRYQEADDAVVLCERVIKGEDHTADEYAERALDPLKEIAGDYDRLHAVVAECAGATHLIDVACGSGAYAISLCQQYPDLKVTAIDFAQGNIDKGREASTQVGVGDRITWICAPVWDFQTNTFSEWWRTFAADGRRFDALWCGEFVEHVADCSALIDGLEAVLLPGAKVVYTCPQGPLGEFVARTVPHYKGHVHHFASDDLLAVWGGKQGVNFSFLPWPGQTQRGSICGNWLITYRSSEATAGQRPYAHRIVTTRPKAKLSVGIIARNAEHDLLKCLDSVWYQADEILVGDTGSTDQTKAIAASIPRKVRLIDLPPIADQPEGFAGARNAVLAACSGDWFLWIDTDETLLGGPSLWKYLEGGPFLGYAMRQNHLQIDAPMHADTPIRLFQRRPDIRFYGCIHEQPQMGDENGDIAPGLEIHDVAVAHTGYLLEGIRRGKMLDRNLPLLKRDQAVFPNRRLGKVLVLRDLVNLADYAAEAHGGQYPPRALGQLQQAVDLFTAHFADPADKFHAIARPWYERALQGLQIGIEMEVALGGKRGGLNGARAKPLRVWVQDIAEFDRFVAFKVNEIRKQMVPPVLQVDPFDEPVREAAAV